MANSRSITNPSEVKLVQIFSSLFFPFIQPYRKKTSSFKLLKKHLFYQLGFDWNLMFYYFKFVKNCSGIFATTRFTSSTLSFQSPTI